MIKFNTEGFRSDFQLNVYELREGAITDIGTWNTTSGLAVVQKSVDEKIFEDDSLRNKTFIVITTLVSIKLYEGYSSRFKYNYR